MNYLRISLHSWNEVRQSHYFKLFQYLYTYICTFSIRMRDLVLYGGTFESPISIVNEQDGLSITIATESCQTYKSDNRSQRGDVILGGRRHSGLLEQWTPACLCRLPRDF